MAGTFNGPHEDGAATPDEQLTSYQQALLRERDGLIARGDARRVADVEAALVASGFELVERATAPEPDAERATTRRGKR